MPIISSKPAVLVAEEKTSRSRNLYHYVRGSKNDNFIHFREDEVCVYEALFRVHLLDDEDTVCADREGRRFIRRSGLPANLLDAILDIACGGSGDCGGSSGAGAGAGAGSSGGDNDSGGDGGVDDRLDDGGDGAGIFDFRGRFISREGWFVMCKLVALHQYYEKHPQHAATNARSGADVGSSGGMGAGIGGGASVGGVSAEELFHYPTGNSPDHEESRGFFREQRLPNFNIAFDKPPPTPPCSYDHASGRRISEGEMEDEARDRAGAGSGAGEGGRYDMGLEVHIDPNPKEKDEEGPLKTKYMEYTVYTRARNGSLSRSEVVAYRRFSDFDWLHQRLRQVYHGILLPPLPQKRARGNHDPDFVRERIHALTRYITHLARHPRLIGSFELEVMLCASHGTGRGLQAAKSIMPAAGQVGGLEEAVSRISESGQDVTERYSTDYGSTDAEADSRSPSPNSSTGSGGGGAGGGVGGSSGSVAVGPTGIAGAANGLIAKAAYTVTAVAGSGAANASGPGELLGAWWGAAKRAVGVGDALMENLDRDEEFDGLSSRRMAYNEQVGGAHKAAEALFQQKRKTAHQTWMLGHALVKAGEAADGHIGSGSADGGAAGGGGSGRRSRSVSPAPPNGPIDSSVGFSGAAAASHAHAEGSGATAASASPDGDCDGSGAESSQLNGENSNSKNTAADSESSQPTKSPVKHRRTNSADDASSASALIDSPTSASTANSADCARSLASGSGLGGGVALLAELGNRLERFGVERQSQLDRELDFVEFMRFQNGFAASEREMVGDRTEAVHKVQRARNEVENSEQRLQRTKRQNIDNSTKVAVALEQLRTAKQQHTNATLRLSAMSANSYKREVEWCDEERVRDMASHLREFVQLQREQAELAQNAFRSLVEMVNATDDELKESEQRVMQRISMGTYEATSAEASWYHGFVRQPAHVHAHAHAHAHAQARTQTGAQAHADAGLPGGGGGGSNGGDELGFEDGLDDEWEDGGLDGFVGDEFMEARSMSTTAAATTSTKTTAAFDTNNNTKKSASKGGAKSDAIVDPKASLQATVRRRDEFFGTGEGLGLAMPAPTPTPTPTPMPTSTVDHHGAATAGVVGGLGGAEGLGLVGGAGAAADGPGPGAAEYVGGAGGSTDVVAEEQGGTASITPMGKDEEGSWN